MAMDVGKSGGLNATINVTPLVDVMLVLLIIMMLVAPMLQKGVAVQMPEATNTEAKPDTGEPTVLAVDAANRFWVNGQQSARADFAEKVKAALEDKGDKVVYIKGDKDALYSAIMQAMDDLRAAGIEDIGLITEPKPEKVPAAVGGK